MQIRNKEARKQEQKAAKMDKMGLLKTQEDEQPSARSDNRRMTGNINIYICSEGIEKGEKNAEVNVINDGPLNHVHKNENAPYTKPEKPRNIGKDPLTYSNSNDEKLISFTDFNKFSSYEVKSNAEKSKMVSCRCSKFDESDLWLQNALKKQNKDPTVNVDSINNRKENQNRRTDTLQEEAGEQLCTCSCKVSDKKQNSKNRKKESKKDKNQKIKVSSVGSIAKISSKDKTTMKEKSKSQKPENLNKDKSKTRHKHKNTPTESVKEKHIKEKNTKNKTGVNENSRNNAHSKREKSFFLKIINIMKSNKEVSTNDKKKLKCIPECTELPKNKKANSLKNKNNNQKHETKSKLPGTIISKGSNINEKAFNSMCNSNNTQANNRSAEDFNVGINCDVKVVCFNEPNKIHGDTSKPITKEANSAEDNLLESLEYSKNEEKPQKHNEESKVQNNSESHECCCIQIKNNPCYYSETLDEPIKSNPLGECTCGKKSFGYERCACKMKKFLKENWREGRGNKPRGSDGLPYQRLKAFPDIVDELRRRIGEPVNGGLR